MARSMTKMQAIKEWWRMIHFSAAGASWEDSTPFWRELLWALLDDAKFRALSIVCRFKGHNLEEDGQTGPDSGCMEFECRRCGWSHREVLY